MNTELYDYYLFPRVVPADRETVLRVIPRGGHARFSQKMIVRVYPLERHDAVHSGVQEITVEPQTDGSVAFPVRLSGEQEHFLRFHTIRDGRAKDPCFLQLSVYSLYPDLYALLPLRGDLHVHTCRSDGREDEAFVLANYRRAGYDFMTVSDHVRYAPSLEAIRQAEKIATGLRVFPGEEVHPLGLHPEYGDWNMIDPHIVHVGGCRSVNEQIRSDAGAFEEEIKPLMAKAPQGVNARTYAACLEAVRKIHACGGLAIFAHPMWLEDDGAYNVEPVLAKALMVDAGFDAFELLGGLTVRENNLQQAFYASLREEGIDLPIVGSSDSHGTTNSCYFEESATIAFAMDDSFAAIREAILNKKSVAVEHYHGEATRTHGSYRLVKYACFLLTEYFPQHDEICRMEGDWMHAWLDGERDCEAIVARCAERLARFQARCFGREE